MLVDGDWDADWVGEADRVGDWDNVGDADWVGDSDNVGDADRVGDADVVVWVALSCRSKLRSELTVEFWCTSTARVLAPLISDPGASVVLCQVEPLSEA